VRWVRSARFGRARLFGCTECRNSLQEFEPSAKRDTKLAKVLAGYAVHRQVPRKGVGPRFRRSQCSKVLEFGEHKAHAATRDAGSVMPHLDVHGRDHASFGDNLGFDVFDDGQRLRCSETRTNDCRRVLP
jgi:hypothetical protein